ncbi:MAG: ATP-binding cassette domain-containing protein [Bacteroidetes bacterium]|jgi:lipopolysaccharide transport system ATP-binding protein|nr:ATP-binding cassette domain-containing protein [Bacteroidota bacterium]
MGPEVIKATGVSKRYRVGELQQEDSVRGMLNSWVQSPVRNFKRIYNLTRFKEGNDPNAMWALKDVSFNLHEGEVLGVIGRNGAGKSTLLKVLSRITEPTHGKITIHGKISSLLEVGTGFHPELSGRDNVYMNGTILGMTKKEIQRKFDEIVSFSGVERHIDTPVKFYSSGMKVRLAFSVAAHLEPDILIIDEVLAVGDLAFQQKCIGKMDNIKSSGRTILFVSHNMNSIEGLCSRCLLMEKGQLIYNGSTAETIDKYQDLNLAKTDSQLSQRTDREGDGLAKFVDIKLNEGKAIVPGEPFEVALQVDAKQKLENVEIAVKICKSYQQALTTLETKVHGATIDLNEGRNLVTARVPRLMLAPGVYSINLWIGTVGRAQDNVFNVCSMMVAERDIYGTGVGVQPEKNGYLLLDKGEWTQKAI